MAKAKAYDCWEDVGMEFGEDELFEYDPEVWASERVAKLCAMRQVVMRRIELPDIPKPLWWKEAGKFLENRIDWYCKALPLVGATDEEKGNAGLPGRSSKAGKELSQAAVLLDERDWIGVWGTDSETSMRYVVTIGRRATARFNWPTNKQKQSNRLANSVNREILATQMLDKSLSSYV